MKYLTILSVLLVAISGYAQMERQRPELTGNVSRDISYLLMEGQSVADIMDGFKQDPRQTELALKFQKGVQENYSWFIEYTKTVPEGKPMPYHPNLGLTHEEYSELQDLKSVVELVSSGQEMITILKHGSELSFEAKGKLKILEFVKINLENNQVALGEYILYLTDTINVTSEQNALKSKWMGYGWRFEIPSDLDLDALKDIANLKAKQYKLTIGRLSKNGKTFMSIKGLEIKNGVKEVQFELPLIF